MDIYLHIFDLPVEVLICIFEFLDSLSLERVVDASKRFSDILLASKRLQSNLTLNIHSKLYYNDMINQSRKLPYKTVNFMRHQDDEIYSDTLEPFVIYDVLANLHKHVDKIQVFNIGILWTMKIFAICDNLKELRIIDDDNLVLFETTTVVNFPVLKVLEIRCSGYCDVLYSIEARNLEKLIIHKSFANLTTFLMKTEKLKVLKIYDGCVDDMQGWDTLKMRLTTLNLGLGNYRVYLSLRELHEERTWTNTLGDFLKSQKSSLEDVALNFIVFEDKSYEIVNACLSQLKLKKLSLKIDKNVTKFNKLSVNNSIKTLKFEGYTSDDNLKHLISCCPQVTSLILNFNALIGSNIFDHISKLMQNLKVFEINSSTLQISDKIILKNVEKLKIYLLNQDLWHQLAMICPNLKELELIDKTIKADPLEIQKVLSKCQNLQTITFNAGMDFICKDGFFDVFTDKNVKVKRINFHAVNFEHLFFSRVALFTAKTNVQVCWRNNLY
ncbi:hypothetical protein ACKWTF_015908 [Chironomus riparius]